MPRTHGTPILAALLLALAWPQSGLAQQPAARPNIVWIVLDDASPDLGAYGDPQAHTPNMDRLAREGVRFTRAFTHSPVCAPSRSGLVTGQYPTTLGSHHMRSRLTTAPEIFTSGLREAGYHVVWPGKTDFNFPVPPGSFDSTDNWLQWTAPPRQPFFAYVNLGTTHESQIRLERGAFAQRTSRLKPAERHDPARMAVPPYYPDLPEVRRDLASYYDLMTVADYQVGDILAKLEALGVADNTVVLLFGDHGRGMPRAKRWIYDSGIHVPLLVRWPGRLSAGSVDSSLVSFIDFAPSMLAIAGAPVPARMQGQAFLTASGRAANARRYVYAARDRMDEAFDRIRAVRSARFKYIRNYHPEIPYAQRINYNEENPTMRAWRRLFADDRLTGPPALFFALRKPREELYDVQADPFEIHNLAEDPRHRATLEEMRAELDRWEAETGDLGRVTEAELVRRGLVEDLIESYEKRKLWP